jgi:hypothetical protein
MIGFLFVSLFFVFVIPFAFSLLLFHSLSVSGSGALHYSFSLCLWRFHIFCPFRLLPCCPFLSAIASSHFSASCPFPLSHDVSLSFRSPAPLLPLLLSSVALLLAVRSCLLTAEAHEGTAFCGSFLIAAVRVDGTHTLRYVFSNISRSSLSK